MFLYWWAFSGGCEGSYCIYGGSYYIGGCSFIGGCSLEAVEVESVSVEAVKAESVSMETVEAESVSLEAVEVESVSVEAVEVKSRLILYQAIRWEEKEENENIICGQIFEDNLRMMMLWKFLTDFRKRWVSTMKPMT